MFKHFKSNVPAELQAKMLELAEYVNDNFEDMHGKPYANCWGDQTVDEISGVGYDGFIPFQDGGYSVSRFAECNQDTSSHFSAAQTAVMSQLFDNCLSDFCDQEEIEKEDFDWDNNELTEKLNDYEQEWFSDVGQMIYFECFADEEMGDSELMITLRSGTNYRDSPYYREKCNDDITSNVISVYEFMGMSIIELFELIRFNKGVMNHGTN